MNASKFKSERMENAHYWAAQVSGWLSEGPNAGIEGRYYVEIIGGRPVIVLDDSFTEETTKAIVSGLKHYEFPNSMNIVDLDEETRIFMTPTDDRLITSFNDEWRSYEVRGGFDKSRFDN